MLREIFFRIGVRIVNLAVNGTYVTAPPNFFTFEDYSVDEIVAIGRLQLRHQEIKFDQPSTEKRYAQAMTELYQNTNDHSNGRWIRNRNDELLRQLAVATANNPDHPLDEIWSEDIEKAFGGGDDSRPGDKPTNLPSSQTPDTFDWGSDDTLPLLNGDELK